ncbi:hypothetical protein ABAC460_06455 [Asticcacaulis sp. AC460]|nr:hypothetical protein ABAC460_06455 [Asticcacaulis sp. AC460]
MFLGLLCGLRRFGFLSLSLNLGRRFARRILRRKDLRVLQAGSACQRWNR